MKKPVPIVAPIVDLPTPQSGGSYLRNDATGELTRIPDPVPVPDKTPASDEKEPT